MKSKAQKIWWFSGSLVLALVYAGGFVGAAYVPLDRFRAFAWIGCGWLLFWSLATVLFTEDRHPSLPSRWLIAVMTFWTLIAGVQILPLPASLVTLLSPPWKLFVQTASSARIAPPSSLTLSTAAEATRLSFDQLLAATGFLFAASVLCTERGGRGFVLRLLIGGTLAAGVFGLFGLGIREGDRLSGIFGNPNHFAAFLATGLPLAASIAWRMKPQRIVQVQSDKFMFLASLVVLCFTSWLLTLSRASIIFGLAAFSVWLVIENRQRRESSPSFRQSRQSRIELVLMVVALLVLIAFSGVSSTLMERLDGTGPGIDLRPRMWIAGFQTFLDAPLLGVGFGGSEYGLNRHLTGIALPRAPVEVHSDWIQLLADTGLTGFLGTVLLTVGLLRSLHLQRLARSGNQPPWLTLERRALATGLVAVLAHSAVDFPLRIPLAGLQFLMATSLFLSTGRLTLKSESHRTHLESARRRQS